jgi:hypothetical protein
MSLRSRRGQFVQVCSTVAKFRHDEGDIAALFGRTIPVIVHELEDHDRIAEQTLKAHRLMPRMSSLQRAWSH